MHRTQYKVNFIKLNKQFKKIYFIMLRLSHILLSILVILVIKNSCATSRSRRNLRSASKGDFVTHHSNLQFGNRSFSLAGPAEWNLLPETVRRSTTSSQFKLRLKSHLFMQYYDQCNIHKLRTFEARLVLYKRVTSFICIVLLYCIV